jgi:uncharacterized phage-associated protein
MPDKTIISPFLNVPTASGISAMPQGLTTSAPQPSMQSPTTIGQANYSITGPISRPSPPKPKRVHMNALTADVVADAIIGFCNEHGDVVTSLRLQRLLYFAQAWFLALNGGKALFTDAIEAHENGPAIPSVSVRFSGFGAGPITHSLGAWVYPKALTDHIAELMEAYGHLSSYDLERLSKEDLPWKSARAHASIGCPYPWISVDIMRDFYKLRLDAQKPRL